MAITAALVKELRDTTGAGMMDAKKALEETDGDMEAAIDWLRTKGLATAAKKSGRVAAEGLVGVAVEGGRGVAVEVNAETDFVAKNAEFQEMVAGITKAALGVADVEALAGAALDGKTVADVVTDKVAKIGENMSLRRMAAVEGDVVATYVHNAAAPGMGQIGVLVALKGGDEAFGKEVAMHVAAANPASLGADDLDPAVLAHERQIQIDIAKDSGKPEQVIEKMIEGRMKKFLAEVTLLGQTFYSPTYPDMTVGEAAAKVGAEIVAFVRMAKGEGIEKRSEDFAAEVAKVVQG